MAQFAIFEGHKPHFLPQFEGVKWKFLKLEFFDQFEPWMNFMEKKIRKLVQLDFSEGFWTKNGIWHNLPICAQLRWNFGSKYGIFGTIGPFRTKFFFWNFWHILLAKNGFFRSPFYEFFGTIRPFAGIIPSSFGTIFLHFRLFPVDRRRGWHHRRSPSAVVSQGRKIGKFSNP